MIFSESILSVFAKVEIFDLHLSITPKIINFAASKPIVTSKMDVPKDDVNSQFTFTYDDIKGTVHVVDHQTGEEYDLLKEDTGWFDAEFKFDV
jgi:hypothetical protein